MSHSRHRFPVPETHRALLREEIGRLESVPDVARMIEKFERERSGMRPTGMRMIDAFLLDLKTISIAAANIDKLPADARLAALGAMSYVLRTNDTVADDAFGAGLVDDALVVIAALEVVEPALKALGISPD